MLINLFLIRFQYTTYFFDIKPTYLFNHLINENYHENNSIGVKNFLIHFVMLTLFVLRNSIINKK